MVCPVCGKEINDENVKFCPNCGYNFVANKTQNEMIYNDPAHEVTNMSQTYNPKTRNMSGHAGSTSNAIPPNKMFTTSLGLSIAGIIAAIAGIVIAYTFVPDKKGDNMFLITLALVFGAFGIMIGLVGALPLNIRYLKSGNKHGFAGFLPLILTAPSIALGVLAIIKAFNILLTI